MQNFTFSGFRRDNGEWQFNVEVPNGETVTFGDVEDLVLIPLLAQIHPKRALRLPTQAEVEAMRPLPVPAHWSPSADGADVNMTIGGSTAYSVAWERSDGARCVAPVADTNKTPNADTAKVLMEYDAAHPLQAAAEA